MRGSEQNTSVIELLQAVPKPSGSDSTIGSQGLKRQLFTITQLNSDIKEERGLEQSSVLSQGEMRTEREATRQAVKAEEGSSW